MSRVPRRSDQLLLGEWACLGVLAEHPSHGFDIARRLAPDGDLGRVWSLSRALTYRSLDQLERRGLIDATAREPGRAGGERTVLSITANGRRALDQWVATPVEHLRDLRSELLLKLVVARNLGIDTNELVTTQRAVVDRMIERTDGTDDVVDAWRHEIALAARRFLDRLA